MGGSEPVKAGDTILVQGTGGVSLQVSSVENTPCTDGPLCMQLCPPVCRGRRRNGYRDLLLGREAQGRDPARREARHQLQADTRVGRRGFAAHGWPWR